MTFFFSFVVSIYVTGVTLYVYQIEIMRDRGISFFFYVHTYSGRYMYVHKGVPHSIINFKPKVGR